MTSTPYGVTQAELGRRYTAQMLQLGVPAEFEGTVYTPKGYKGTKSKVYRMAGDGSTYGEQERGTVAAEAAPGQVESFLEPATGATQPVEPKVIEVDPATFARANKPKLPSWEPENEVEIDLDLDEQQPKTLRFKNVRQPNGEKVDVTLTIPPVRVEYAMKAGRIQAQIAKTWQKMVDTTDDRVADKLDKQVKELNEQLVRLLVPDLPAGLLFSLGPKAWQKITETVNNATQEAMGERTDWQGYVRDIYVRIGAPHGKTQTGLFMWLKEHFSDLEDAYPNE